MLLEPVGELGVGGLLHQGLDLGVAELVLRLALELRLAQAHRDDAGEALSDVFAAEVRVLLLEHLLVAGVAVDHRGQRGPEALFVRAAADGGDAVGEAVEPVGLVALVPLEGQLDLGVVGLVVEVADPGEQRGLGGVDVLDEVDDAARVLVGDGLVVVVGPLVLESDLQGLVEEGHHLEALEHGAGHELGGLEEAPVRPEGDGGARAAAGCVADDLELGLLGAAFGELDLVALAVAVDLDHDLLRHGVDHGHAHAVEAAGHLVAVAAEFAAAAQLGERDLDAAQLELGVDVGGDAAAVVDHAAAAVGQEGDVDPVAVAGHGLVDRVVDHLPDEVVETGDAGATDVHARALAHVREPLEDGHVTSGVGLLRGRHSAAFQGRAGGR